MRGERLSAVDIGMHGVIGDRAYALREASGRVVTAKKWANMLEFGSGPVLVTSKVNMGCSPLPYA
jgi:uncharacterized protein YcbX